MSLVTRCPACGTTFKVVRDQLRISDGWVRCGRCSEVFDATLDLLDAAAEGAAPAAAPVHASPGAAPQERSATAEPAPPVQPPRAEDDASPSAAGPTAKAPAAELSSAQASDRFMAEEAFVIGELNAAEAAPVVPPYPTFPPFPAIDLSLPVPQARSPRALQDTAQPTSRASAAAAEDSGDIQLQKALRRARAKSAKIAKARQREARKTEQAQAASPLIVAPSEPEPGSAGPFAAAAVFVPQAEQAATGRWASAVRLFGRGALLAIVAALTLLLLVQVVLHQRDAIAASQPELRPALASLCALAGCQVGPLRRIGDITIDGASFARDRATDGFNLRFRLRSAATIPIAMPAVEVSLLDSQERAVVRRVMLPAEFGAPEVLPARADREASLQLSLVGPDAGRLPPVVGYRLEALYP